jgi:hypothetical protein
MKTSESQRTAGCFVIKGGIHKSVEMSRLNVISPDAALLSDEILLAASEIPTGITWHYNLHDPWLTGEAIILVTM